ncbi:hypothetical protein Tco_0433150 [Tanacetum coccineum]
MEEYNELFTESVHFKYGNNEENTLTRRRCPFVQNAKLNSKFVNNMLPDGAIHTEVNSTEVQKSSNNHPESPQSFKSTINIADNFQLDNRSTVH